MNDFHAQVRDWFNEQEWFSTILPFDEVNDVRHFGNEVQISGTVMMPSGPGLQQHVVRSYDSLEDFAQAVIR